MQVAVVGCGVVGGNFAKLLEQRHEVRRYDPAKGFNDSISDADIVFVCVNSVTTDLPELHGAVEYVAQNNLCGLIAIRTTVLPGTTDALSEQYGREFAFVPEFLREASAWEDTLNPDKLVIGAHSQEAVDRLLEVMTADRDVEPLIMTPASAELAKLSLNTLALIKVVFANEVYDISHDVGADYANILEVFRADQNVNERHLDPLHGDCRGAGGKCLPKDSAFMAAIAASPLISMAEKLNRKLLST